MSALAAGLTVAAGTLGAASFPPEVCPWSAAAFAAARRPQPVVLMTLSPRMVYSLLEWRRMRAIAVAEGFCVVPARDPRVPEGEWQQAVSRAGLPELRAAPSLADLGVPQALFLNHAPTSQVWRCGHAHPWPILGVMTDVGWRRSLHARLADLKRDAPCDP
ncbi:MAG: hypothetical protein LBQ32_06680 [Burkholderiaceae bacterium]|jgi:hypothetical protein|nr:hypothetical protein [Burkholderiaceae bacterium]